MTTTANKNARSAVPDCPGCGRIMRLRWIVPDPSSGYHDLRQFTCACGVQYGDRVVTEPKAEVA